MPSGSSSLLPPRAGSIQEEGLQIHPAFTVLKADVFRTRWRSRFENLQERAMTITTGLWTWVHRVRNDSFSQGRTWPRCHWGRPWSALYWRKGLASMLCAPTFLVHPQGGGQAAWDTWETRPEEQPRIRWAEYPVSGRHFLETKVERTSVGINPRRPSWTALTATLLKAHTCSAGPVPPDSFIQHIFMGFLLWVELPSGREDSLLWGGCYK